MRFEDALAEAEIEAACDRLAIEGRGRDIILARYRRGDHGRARLAACVLTHAIFADEMDPMDRDRAAVECGASQFVGLAATVQYEDLASLRWPSRDWIALLAAECDRLGMSGPDKAFVLGELRRSDGAALASFVEVAALASKLDGEAGTFARMGCRRYAESRIWRRDRLPVGPPLSLYAAAG